MNWDKTQAVEFFQKNLSKTVLLKEKSSRFRVQAQLQNITELDMCSSSLFEAIFSVKTEGVLLSITFHDDFIGTHLSTTLPDLNQPEISLPYQIRYENLILETQ